jgi:GTP cyclohydrolase II
MKVEHLERGGLRVDEQIPLVAGVGRYNVRYLHAKREKGHTFEELPDPEE